MTRSRRAKKKNKFAIVEVAIDRAILSVRRVHGRDARATFQAA